MPEILTSRKKALESSLAHPSPLATRTPMSVLKMEKRAVARTPAGRVQRETAEVYIKEMRDIMGEEYQEEDDLYPGEI